MLSRMRDCKAQSDVLHDTTAMPKCPCRSDVRQDLWQKQNQRPRCGVSSCKETMLVQPPGGRDYRFGMTVCSVMVSLAGRGGCLFEFASACCGWGRWEVDELDTSRQSVVICCYIAWHHVDVDNSIGLRRRNRSSKERACYAVGVVLLVLMSILSAGRLYGRGIVRTGGNGLRGLEVFLGRLHQALLPARESGA